MNTPRHPLIPLLAEINWGIVGIVCALSFIGFIMMVSAGGGAFSPWAWPQIIRFALAFVLMLVIALLPMRLLLDYAYLIYFGGLLVLVGVDVVGHMGGGAQRWLKLGGVGFQPSEFMKLAMMLAVARYFHRLYPGDIQRPIYLILPVLIILAPAFLIYRQPSLGSAVIVLAVGGIMCFLAGVRWQYFAGIAAVALVSAPLAWQFLHDYQKQRVMTFLDPQQDPLGAGYNILQSMIAIGSGGFFGKGFLEGSQSQLNFLPEKHTDFIFTMLAEEWGFFGSALVLGLYFTLLVAGMTVAQASRSTFGALLAAGVTAMFFLHVLINCGMVMGLLPVVGVPLPLVSYGGTSMVTLMAGFGILMAINGHRNLLAR